MKRPDEQPLSSPPLVIPLCSKRHDHDTPIGKTPIKIFRSYTQRKRQMRIDRLIVILASILSIDK